MLPLAAIDGRTAARVRGLLFDLDDTVLDHGVLTRVAYEALWDLHQAGMRLVVVTGRPASWGELLVMQWPIDAAVTENGAVAVLREGRKAKKIDRCDPAERSRRRARLREIGDVVAKAAPEVQLADDASGRVSDVTWDIGENARVPGERIREIEAIIRGNGARSSCSSVHLHATFDADDKATGVIRLMHEHFAVDVTAARHRYAFVGDSGNDRACFAAFETTFGVANVRDHIGALTRTPRFVTPSAMGEGFAELARALLSGAASEPEMR